MVGLYFHAIFLFGFGLRNSHLVSVHGPDSRGRKTDKRGPGTGATGPHRAPLSVTPPSNGPEPNARGAFAAALSNPNHIPLTFPLWSSFVTHSFAIFCSFISAALVRCVLSHACPEVLVMPHLR
ncbi:hypothetical protein B0T20DRAFT_168612 [Sordaria brevicollis]|uniref:Secreted protein n=1 Tax=Sordaria brevicollis TaxID=83679 RepID=A0AAE0PH07_SORBR|nr:hypothetical protein B0T20DRAFT_168612 [Sordaria brevicollis]